MDERVDNTAVRVALWRALHAEIDAPPHVLDDTLGLRLVDPPEGWRDYRVLLVSALLRELIHALEGSQPGARDDHLMQLILAEMTSADTQSLGVALPRDKRLRSLCEAVLRAPTERATLADWSSDVGASERTVARLFRSELGTSYQQWRQQAVLAHAMPLLARGLPVGQVAEASGYASASAFCAMFKAAMGQPPSAFQA